MRLAPRLSAAMPNLALATTLAAAGGLLAVPATAGAATSCRYLGAPFNLLEVDMSANGDSAILSVAGNGEIVVRNIGGTIPCTGANGPPDVDNTNAITADGAAGGHLVQIDGASRFAPGQSTVDESGGDPEIEIFPRLASGGEVRVIPEDAGGSVRLGQDGINPNAVPGEVQPDADIFPTGVFSLSSVGGPGPDIISAQGGAGTGAALTRGLLIQGASGSDTLTGSDGNDDVFGEAGNDAVLGMDGGDRLDPGRDRDTVDGGAGIDTVDYNTVPAGVTVDVALAGPQDTDGAGTDSLASIENVTGTFFADVLRGDGGPNALRGRQGSDILEGRGGIDFLEGESGDDWLDVRDGGPDTADCGPDADTVTVDLPGLDMLTGCETTLFPAPAGPGPGPGPGGESGTTVDFAPSLTALSLTNRTFRVGRRPRGGSRPVRSGTAFRLRLSEAARVTFAIERRTTGRRVRGRCQAQTRRNRRAGRCIRHVRVGSFAKQLAAGRRKVRFSGRLGGRALRRARYSVTAHAVDATGKRSARRSATFRVVR